MPKKRKKFNRQTHNNNILVGCQFMWTLVDPLGDKPEVTRTSHSHKVPGKRIMMTRNLNALYEITLRRKLKWHVGISVLFQQDGRPYSRNAELVIQGLLKDPHAEDEFQRVIEEIFTISNMDHYIRCDIVAEIIGTDAIEESDFTYSKSEAA